MVIHNVEINIDFDKWKSDICKEVSEYEEYYSKRKTKDKVTIGIAFVMSILYLVLTVLFCTNPEEHDFLYHLFGAFVIALLIVFAVCLFKSTEIFERSALHGMYGSDLDDIIEYVNNEQDTMSCKDSFEFLDGVPGIRYIVHNWEYVRMLHTEDIMVYADPMSGLEITLYNKSTKRRVALNVNQIYSDHNEPEDGSEGFTLLIDEDTIILYEDGLFDGETKVNLLN